MVPPDGSHRLKSYVYFFEVDCTQLIQVCLFVCLNYCVFERQTEKEQALPSADKLPKCLQWPGQAKTRKQELNPGFPYGWQGSNAPSLLPPRVHRKLELGQASNPVALCGTWVCSSLSQMHAPSIQFFMWACPLHYLVFHGLFNPLHPKSIVF